jgi:predicted ATPase
MDMISKYVFTGPMESISSLIWDAYRSIGYRPILIPDTSLEKRSNLVLRYVK